MAKPRFALALDGLDELRRTVGDLAPKEADRLVGDCNMRVAERVESRLFRRLQNKTRTGRLMRSTLIRRKRPDRGVHVAEVRGGANAPYLLMREFGTSKTAPSPSIGPAVEETRPEVPALYRDQFFESLAKVLKSRARKGGG